MAARHLALVALVFAPLACGKKGDPLPPLRHVPARVEKVAVAQRGGFIHLEWEAPRKTNHGSPRVELKEAQVLRRVVEPPPVAAKAPAPEEKDETEVPAPATAPPTRPPSFQEQAVVIATLEVPSDGGPVSYRDPWDPSWEGQRVEYAVRHRNRKGAPSEVSPVASLEPAPPLTAPAGLEVVVADGFVRVTWREDPRGLFGFDLFRRSEDRYPLTPLNAAPLAVARYEDREALWGTPSCYQVKKVAVVAPVAPAEGVEPPPETELVRSPAVIESPESAEACLTAVDTFAPPPPESPVALAAAGGILISWKEVAAVDLGGYLVYRALAADGPFELLTEKPVQVGTYTDRGVEPGRMYFYAASAVDRTVPPNESERTPVVSARASQ